MLKMSLRLDKREFESLELNAVSDRLMPTIDVVEVKVPTVKG